MAQSRSDFECVRRLLISRLCSSLCAKRDEAQCSLSPRCAGSFALLFRWCWRQHSHCTCSLTNSEQVSIDDRKCTRSFHNANGKIEMLTEFFFFFCVRPFAFRSSYVACVTSRIRRIRFCWALQWVVGASNCEIHIPLILLCRNVDHSRILCFRFSLSFFFFVDESNNEDGSHHPTLSSC